MHPPGSAGRPAAAQRSRCHMPADKTRSSLAY